MPVWADMVLVGRVARPHGLRGHTVITPETDFVEARFAKGERLWVGGDGEPSLLVIDQMRVQHGRPVVRFAGLETIEAVQRLAGRELRVEIDVLHPLDAGGYYHHELVGGVVETAGGEVVGTVAAVEGGGARCRLVVRGPRGDVQVPFVEEICGLVDTAARRIRIDPPEGLLDLNLR